MSALVFLLLGGGAAVRAAGALAAVYGALMLRGPFDPLRAPAS